MLDPARALQVPDRMWETLEKNAEALGIGDMKPAISAMRAQRES